MQALSELDSISIHDGKTEFDVASQKSKSRWVCESQNQNKVLQYYTSRSLLRFIEGTPSPKKPSKRYLLDGQEEEDEEMIKTSPVWMEREIDNQDQSSLCKGGGDN